MTRDADLDPLPVDEITTELRQFAGTLGGSLVGVAAVGRERAEDAGVVEGADVVPQHHDAVGVWWEHSSEDIVVGIGQAPGWELPRSAGSVDVVRAIVEEAIAGRVEVGRGRGITTYRVRTSDGVVREDTHEGLAGFLLSMPWKPRMRWKKAAPYSFNAVGE
ncbi:hypothetical protein [uncultured Cellulomonas sp.]|uniref:hypothetical protein n=1 Tax=uncultured Cellulomonas sp. TaxID=189682 RepID=UPI00262847C2|nr:hypothetical protein [uncultured Cellulomonas sp.]